MLILGIDPGSRFTGWGLLRNSHGRHEYLSSGTLRLDPGKPLAQRLLLLDQGLEALLTQYRPEHCALEQIFTARNARSALVLGHARGVIMCAMARQGVALHEYSPAQVKQAVVGVGRAGKDQIQRMVALLLGRHEGFQEDEADALAVALTHAAVSRLEGRT
jgi:crossover junction endodeoxyribonuclease RuvC